MPLDNVSSNSTNQPYEYSYMSFVSHSYESIRNPRCTFGTFLLIPADYPLHWTILQKSRFENDVDFFTTDKKLTALLENGVSKQFHEKNLPIHH